MLTPMPGDYPTDPDGKKEKDMPSQPGLVTDPELDRCSLGGLDATKQHHVDELRSGMTREPWMKPKEKRKGVTSTG